MNLWMSTIRNSHPQGSCRRGRWWGGIEIKFVHQVWARRMRTILSRVLTEQSSLPRYHFVPLLSTESSLVDQIADTMSCKSCLESISLCSRFRDSCRHVSAAAECNQKAQDKQTRLTLGEHLRIYHFLYCSRETGLMAIYGSYKCQQTLGVVNKPPSW